MRMIGHVNGEAKARNFGDYLFVQGIENQIEPEKDGSYAVWIHREEDLERGRELLAKYAANPSDPRFQNHSNTADQLREEKRREQEAYEKRLKQGRQMFRSLAAYGIGPVTSVLIVICIAVFIGEYTLGPGFVEKLSISGYDGGNPTGATFAQMFMERVTHLDEVLPEIRHGQVWRLLTPIFLHFGIIHIFFNMLWLRDLGSMIEARQGSGWFLLQVLAFGVFSNLAQYFTYGAGFGGMSGVVYGLLGYIWIRGKFDPASGLYLHPSTVMMMLVWLFVCMIGVFGAVANAAHAAGLVIGMAWGWVSSLQAR